MHLAGEGQVWGAGGRAVGGGGRRIQNPKGPETLLSWPGAPWVHLRDGVLGREPVPPAGPAPRTPAPAPSSGAHLVATGPWPQDGGTRGGPSVGPQGRCRGFCWKPRKEAEEKQRVPWAGMWKELTQPHVVTKRTSLRDSTGPRDGLKAPVLRGTEGSLWALSSPGTGTSPSEKQAGRQRPQLSCWDPWAQVACQPLPPRSRGPGPLAQAALSPPARLAQLEHAGLRSGPTGRQGDPLSPETPGVQRPQGNAPPSLWGLRQRPGSWASPGWHTPHPRLGDLRRKGESSSWSLRLNLLIIRQRKICKTQIMF